MEKLKLFEQFVSELDRNITKTDTILNKIGAERVYMGDELMVNSEKFNNIEQLVLDKDFLEKLNKKNFKKGNIEYTKDCETFLEDNLDLKFLSIFNKDDSELNDPEYIVLQSKPSKSYKWNQIKMYKVNGNIRRFYDTMTNKTIEIKDGKENYIYLTSNAGKDWTLQNIDKKNKTYKNIMSDDEIKQIMRTRKIDIEEIS